MHFLLFSYEFFENFLNFSGVRGTTPDPLLGRPRKVLSPKRNSGAPVVSDFCLKSFVKLSELFLSESAEELSHTTLWFLLESTSNQVNW